MCSGTASWAVSDYFTQLHSPTSIRQSPAFSFQWISYVSIMFLPCFLSLCCSSGRICQREKAVQTGAVKTNVLVLSWSQFASNSIWWSSIKPTDLKSHKCIHTHLVTVPCLFVPLLSTFYHLLYGKKGQTNPQIKQHTKQQWHCLTHKCLDCTFTSLLWTTFIFTDQCSCILSACICLKSKCAVNLYWS